MAQMSEWCFGTRATGTCAFSPAEISAVPYMAKDHMLVGQRATRGQMVGRYSPRIGRKGLACREWKM